MERKYHLFDLKNEKLGRLATQAARILSGRDKVDFKPNVDGGDFVVFINSDNLQMSGEKGKKKLYHTFSGYPGGVKTLSLDQMKERDSRKVVREAVYGMLPKNKLRDEMIKRLKVYTDEKNNEKIDVSHV